MFTLFVAANVVPAIFDDYTGIRNWFFSLLGMKILLVVTSMLNGFGAGLIWVSFGTYVAQCATEESKGYMFGLFWFIFNWCNIIGPFAGAMVL